MIITAALLKAKILDYVSIIYLYISRISGSPDSSSSILELHRVNILQHSCKMEDKTISDGIDSFVDLRSNISFYKPLTSDTTDSGQDIRLISQSPFLIVLCTWLGGATTRQIRKYTSHYQQLFPNACILLIRTTLLHITLHSFKHIHDRLAPARDATRKLLGKRSLSHGNPDDTILLHVRLLPRGRVILKGI